MEANFASERSTQITVTAAMCKLNTNKSLGADKISTELISRALRLAQINIAPITQKGIQRHM